MGSKAPTPPPPAPPKPLHVLPCGPCIICMPHSEPEGIRLDRKDHRPGHIISILIEQNYNVSYKVVWWDSSTRNELWMVAAEVAPSYEAQGKKVIGFHNE